LRLRRGDYEQEALGDWARRIRSQPWEEAFVYFKHETQAPNLALAFAAAGAG
jgi:uncharacterized protein YecE (DUF72 family)